MTPAVPGRIRSRVHSPGRRPARTGEGCFSEGSDSDPEGKVGYGPFRAPRIPQSQRGLRPSSSSLPSTAPTQGHLPGPESHHPGRYPCQKPGVIFSSLLSSSPRHLVGHLTLPTTTPKCSQNRLLLATPLPPSR